MPGCLGLDAMWQLVGFFLGWIGAPGRGRALGVGEVKFTGQVPPTSGRWSTGSTSSGSCAEARHGRRRRRLEADGKPIYEAKDLRVGLFKAADALAWTGNAR